LGIKSYLDVVTLKVYELGERELVKMISRLIECDAAICPGSDDCAAIEYNDQYVVVTTDMLHRKAHFPREMTGYQIGWMATAANLSDIAAMGATPMGVTMALGIPKDTDVDFVLDVIKGINGCCRKFGTYLLGGDTDEHDEVTLVGTALGTVNKDNILTRSGAKVGDAVCITGQLGLAAAGVRILLQELTVADTVKNNAMKRLFEPEPRITEGIQLAASGVVTSLIDTSDGLAISLYELAKASAVGFHIVSDTLPISEEVTSVATDRWDVLTLSIYRGGDYELLFTVPKTSLERVPIPFTVIGRVIQEGMKLEVDGVVYDLKEEGYEHLSGTSPKL
jgi:thiamine-monophosphate kinase